MKNYYHISFTNLYRGTNIKVNKIKFHKNDYKFINSNDNKSYMIFNNKNIINIIYEITKKIYFHHQNIFIIKVSLYKHDLINILKLLESEDSTIIKMGLEILINNAI
jgi:hypothetical protein